MFRDFPLEALHPTAPVGHQASLCVVEQGVDLFWEYHDALFENQRQLDRDSLERYAAQLELDGEAEEALCQEIERHMEGCENCRIVVDTLAKTIHLYRERGHTPLPDDARQRLAGRSDEERWTRGHHRELSQRPAGRSARSQ